MRQFLVIFQHSVCSKIGNEQFENTEKMDIIYELWIALLVNLAEMKDFLQWHFLKTLE